MQEIDLSCLEEILLTQNTTSLTVKVASKKSRGTASLNVTVIKRDTIYYLITLLFEFRERVIRNVYQGSWQELEVQLKELGISPNDSNWMIAGEKREWSEDDDE